jgi:hypothetical protein
MFPRKLTGLSWRELPAVTMLRLIVGNTFGQLGRLILLEHMSALIAAKR